MASSAVGVRWTELRVHFAHHQGVESEGRTKVGDTLGDVPCVAVKAAVACGHGMDAQSVPPKALSQPPHPVVLDSVR